MTLGDIATKARFLTNTDTNSYPDANLLIDINLWYQKVVSMILESVDESDFDDARRTNYPIQTTPMIAGQRDYTMPVSEKVLKIKRLDVTYDGTNWFRATPFDDGENIWGMGNDTLTDQHFIQGAPRYDVKYNSFWLYPMPSANDVAAGGSIRVEWSRQIQPFTSSDYTSVLTDSTDVPGYDDPFHPMLAEGAALEYSRARQLPQMQELTQSLADWETRLRQAYGRKDLDRMFRLGPAHGYYDGR
jgi:hypothetical protein